MLLLRLAGFQTGDPLFGAPLLGVPPLRAVLFPLQQGGHAAPADPRGGHEGAEALAALPRAPQRLPARRVWRVRWREAELGRAHERQVDHALLRAPGASNHE